MTSIAIIGASSGPGATLFERLHAKGTNVVGIARNQTKMAALSKLNEERGLPPLRWKQADANNVEDLRKALEGVRIVIECAAAHLVQVILEATQHDLDHLIAVGSARRFTSFPDAHAASVRAMERYAAASPVPVTLLHPTMIYGARGENNVTRIVQFVRTCPLIPLPKGGRALIQPIHCDNVVDCLESALEKQEAKNKTIIIAGPEPMSYADFVRACARSAGLAARIVPLPGGLLMAAAPLSRFIPGLPDIDKSEVRRLMEDKDVDISVMKKLLGVTPFSLEEGLRRVENQ